MYSVSRSGWSSAPRVPATQCFGQLSMKSGSSEKCAPGSTCQSWVATTWSNCPWWASTYSLMAPAKLRPAFDGQGAAFAEVVLDVDDDQGAGHQFSS